MYQDCNTETLNRIAYLERKEAELSKEEASLPTHGALRRDWLRVRKELRRTRDELTRCRDEIQRTKDFEKAFGLEDIPQEERDYYDSMYRQYEAEQRRKQFRVIRGGKS